MWKKIMRARTASERVNKRLLVDYKLEQHRARGKKRIFWWSIIHSINILQDAAQKAKSGSFIDLLTQDCAA